MKITEEMVKEIILEVLQQMQKTGASTAQAPSQAGPLDISETGDAKTGTDKNEVVVGLPPAFGSIMTQTITNIPHKDVLREIMAGIEEEGLKVKARILEKDFEFLNKRERALEQQVFK